MKAQIMKMLVTIKGKFFAVGVLGALLVIVGLAIQIWFSDPSIDLFGMRVATSGVLIGIPTAIAGIVVHCNGYEG